MTNGDIEQDVRHIKNIGDSSQFLYFMKECARRVGQLLNLTSIAQSCGIAVNTAKSWLQVLETSYLVYRLPPYPVSFGGRVVKAPKLYFSDTGLLCFLLGIKSPVEVCNHSEHGMIAENFMLNDLIRLHHHRGDSVSSVYFWRDHRGFEVDCLIEHRGTLRGIFLQSCSQETEIEFQEIERWKRESKSKPMENYVVYGGKSVRKQRHSTWVLSWLEILSSTNGILLRDVEKYYKKKR